MSARKSVHYYNVFVRLFSIFVVSFLSEPHTNTILTFLKHINECDFVSVSEFNKYGNLAEKTNNARVYADGTVIFINTGRG